MSVARRCASLGNKNSSSCGGGPPCRRASRAPGRGGAPGGRADGRRRDRAARAGSRPSPRSSVDDLFERKRREPSTWSMKRWSATACASRASRATRRAANRAIALHVSLADTGPRGSRGRRQGCARVSSPGSGRSWSEAPRSRRGRAGHRCVEAMVGEPVGARLGAQEGRSSIGRLAAELRRQIGEVARRQSKRATGTVWPRAATPCSSGRATYAVARPAHAPHRGRSGARRPSPAPSARRRAGAPHPVDREIGLVALDQLAREHGVPRQAGALGHVDEQRDVAVRKRRDRETRASDAPARRPSPATDRGDARRG